MGKTILMVAGLACALTANLERADAADPAHSGKMYLAPFGGYTHLRIDKRVLYAEPDTIRFDAAQLGATLGYRTPFGMLLEIGRSNALHADIFDEHGDYELVQTYGAIGWQIDFADGWHLSPRIGRGRWELTSGHRVLLDGAGVRQFEIKGWDNFWEVALMRDVSQAFGMGVNFKDVDQEFGHARIAEFLVRFQF